MRVRVRTAKFEMIKPCYAAYFITDGQLCAASTLQLLQLDASRAQMSIDHCSSRDAHLEQVSLLHDPEELLLVDLAVTITVGFVDHLLELLVSHPLTKLLCDALEILERDLAGLVIVEQAEGLEDLVLRIAIENLLRHHRHELREFDGARPVIVDILDHLLNLLLLRFETKSAHRNLQLLRVDRARAIRVEEVERFLDLLLLLLGQLLLLPAAATETPTQRHRRNFETSRLW